MRMPLIHRWLQKAVDSSPDKEIFKKRRRRGVTAMEYLVMASLVIVVLIMAVQHIGAVTGGLFGNSANATNKTISTGS